MASDSRWDGTLTVDQFRSAATSLQEGWKKAASTLPHWSWIPCSSSPYASTASTQVEGYLCLENVLCLREDEVTSGEEVCPSMEKDSVIDADDCILVLDAIQTTHSYDFHIVYSFSYRVPVLYFRGYKSNGQPMDICSIEKDLPLYSSKVLKESKWTYITYEEHPHLHRPWLMLHPCATSEWMKLLLSGTKGKQPRTDQYLASWLSVAGQAVGLKIPFEMKATKQGQEFHYEELHFSCSD